MGRKIALLGSLSVLLLVAPFILPEFPLRVLIGILLWAGLAQSWNVIGGYTGYLNFAHGAFFGIGAYVTAIGITKLHLSLWITLPAGGVITALLALVMGIPTLRLKGPYFAIATWAFGEMIKQLALVLPWTNGAYGIQIPTPHDDVAIYYAMLGLVALTLVVIWYLLERSAFGYRLRAIREHEIAAETLGIDTTRAKLQAFALSAFFPGVLGGLDAYWIAYIHPQSVLDALIVDQMVVMVLLGGLGSFWGPVLGAGLLWTLNRTIWTLWGGSVAYLMLLGIAVCVVVLYLPDGIVGLWDGQRRTGWRANLARLGARFGVGVPKQ